MKVSCELVVVLALDVLLVHVGGHGVVDVQQGDSVAGDAQCRCTRSGRRRYPPRRPRGCPWRPGGCSHSRAQSRTGLGKAGQHLSAKATYLPCALVLLRPVQQGQLKLRHAAAADPGSSCPRPFPLPSPRITSGMRGSPSCSLIGHQQIQLGVLLDFHAQLIQALDGSVAGEEVLGPRAEGDDLQVSSRPCTARAIGTKSAIMSAHLVGGAHGILGDVGVQMLRMPRL